MVVPARHHTRALITWMRCCRLPSVIMTAISMMTSVLMSSPTVQYQAFQSSSPGGGMSNGAPPLLGCIGNNHTIATADVAHSPLWSSMLEWIRRKMRPCAGLRYSPVISKSIQMSASCILFSAGAVCTPASAPMASIVVWLCETPSAAAPGWAVPP